MPDFRKDYEAGRTLLTMNGLPCFEAPLHLEGGSIHSDGEGTLVVTEECLLDPSRNPSLGKEGIEQARWARPCALFLVYLVSAWCTTVVYNSCHFLAHSFVYMYHKRAGLAHQCHVEPHLCALACLTHHTLAYITAQKLCACAPSMLRMHAGALPCTVLIASFMGLLCCLAQMLMDYLGLEKVIWLWRGMEGDMEVVNGAAPLPLMAAC